MYHTCELKGHHMSEPVYVEAEGATTNRVTHLSELPFRRANSFQNAFKRLHARQGNPPNRGTMSACQENPSRRAIFFCMSTVAPRLSRLA